MIFRFSYLKFQEDEARVRENFCPLLLREYLGRWYVCGNFMNTEHLFTFGLDRMSLLNISEETFIPILDNPASMFDSVIGVAMMEPVTVELAFSCKQAKYIKTLPLHRSQEIVSETGDEVVVRLFVAPNYELVQRILMYGFEVRVLKPASLVEEIKGILKETLEYYK